MDSKKLTFFTIGIVFVLFGLFVPSQSFVESSRPTPVSEDLSEKLILGATLFRAGLILLGVIVLTAGERITRRTSAPMEAANDGDASKLEMVILLGILCAAFALRLYRLDYGLWLDEIITYVKYARSPFGEIITTLDAKNNHFLNSLLAHASFLVFGESAWSLRLPAALFGVAGIVAMYLFSREVSGAREALFSAALLAVSYHHIWFSQNARGYSALLFWTLFSSWLFVRAVRGGRPDLWPPYACAAALGVYSQLLMLYVIAGQFVIYAVLLFVRRGETWLGRWRGFFCGFCLAGFFTMLCYAPVLPQMIVEPPHAGETTSTHNNLLWLLYEFCRGLGIGFSGIIPAILALLILGIGVYLFAREEPIVVGLLVLPALILVSVQVPMGLYIAPRFLFFVLGFGALVLVRGTLHVGDRLARFLKLKIVRPDRIGSACGLVLILISAVSLPGVYLPKQDYLGALAFLRENKTPGDNVATVAFADFPFRDLWGVNWHKVETAQELMTTRTQAERTWVVYTLPGFLENRFPGILAVIQRDFTTVEEFPGTVDDGAIIVGRADEP